MNKSIRSLMGVLAAALVFAGVSANSAMAQDKAKAAKAEPGKPTITQLAENDKVKVYTVRYNPGDENTSIANTTTRVVRNLDGGTLVRTYADGRTEKVVWKPGEVRILGADMGKYTSKNAGKKAFVNYVVQLK